MCAGFRVFVWEYEYAYAWVWSELFEVEYMGLLGEVSRLNLGEVKFETVVLKYVELNQG